MDFSLQTQNGIVRIEIDSLSGEVVDTDDCSH